MVSVIIPTYNRVHTLKRAIDSVLCQTYTEHEIIVVDDGSTDSTKSFLSSQYEYRVQCFSIPHAGVSRARNTGINNANGDWIALLDSDDYWLPDKLEKQIHFFKTNPEYKICHTDEIWIKNGKRINQGKKHKKFMGWFFSPSLHLCLISPSAVMIHKSIFDITGMFDEELEFVEDYDLWRRITSKFLVGYIDKKLVVKTGGHIDQLSRRIDGIEKYRLQVLEKIISANVLKNRFLKEAMDAYQKKCAIYIAGCRKREKYQEINEIQIRMERIINTAQNR